MASLLSTVGKVFALVTYSFTYLGSTITSNTSLDAEFDKCITKATAVISN